MMDPSKGLKSITIWVFGIGSIPLAATVAFMFGYHAIYEKMFSYNNMFKKNFGELDFVPYDVCGNAELF